jgi:hypothetical protein
MLKRRRTAVSAAILLMISTAVLLPACQPQPTKGTPMTTQLEPNSTLPANWWKPEPGLTWQWEINSVDIDTTVEAEVYDIDLYVDQAKIDLLHARGVKLICYINVGSWENWRPDIDRFPEEILGKDYEGWPGERWLDIRRMDLLAPIMRARLDLCQSKGFDAVEPDNMEVYTNDTGFPLTYTDQLDYALWLADEAHQRGLAIGQKNASDQTQDLVGIYDFAISEDCFAQGWCSELEAYIQNHKPVFASEYTDMKIDFSAACRQGRKLGFSMILKNRDLKAWRQICE